MFSVSVATTEVPVRQAYHHVLLTCK